MAQVYVGVGSNLEPERHLRQALERLRARYGTLEVSTVYRSPAVGFKGPPFLNVVVGFEAPEPPDELWRELRAIEHALGRRRSEPKLSSRPIDLDLLLVDNLVVETETFTLPHRDILRYAFVLRPLAELAGERVHPVLGRPLAALNQELELEPRELEPVQLEP